MDDPAAKSEEAKSPASPTKPIDSSVSRVRAESGEGGRVRTVSGGSTGSPKSGHRPKLYKQISTESKG